MELSLILSTLWSKSNNNDNKGLFVQNIYGGFWFYSNKGWQIKFKCIQDTLLKLEEKSYSKFEIQVMRWNLAKYKNQFLFAKIDILVFFLFKKNFKNKKFVQNLYSY